MLSSAEIKIVVATLSKRRAWLRKTLEDAHQDPDVRKEHIESIRLLENAMKKLAATAPASTASVAPAKAAAAKTPRKLSMATARVLVAEDNADSAKLLMDILEDFGMKLVDLATDGKEAFDKIKAAESPYDLILCDWDMPELTGLEVHTKAKASNTLKNAHFMMVTAVSEAARIREAIQQGVNDYIVKPIDIDVLEGKIKAALELEEENNSPA
ncbi:two-component system, chemotaxis family, response regulator CheY [Alteromonadaceae bacterium Bs31]|nr:two-component system, chemotaxis family, response regulator CheY [Alteromonadaceae bacterium Bs31]